MLLLIAILSGFACVVGLVCIVLLALVIEGQFDIQSEVEELGDEVNRIGTSVDTVAGNIPVDTMTIVRHKQA